METVVTENGFQKQIRRPDENGLKWWNSKKISKQVGQNFIELKHMAVVILLNYLKTKEWLIIAKLKD